MSSRIFQGAFLFLTFLFINIGYYLYQLVLGKFMTVEDFGMMSTLFAFQFLLLIPATIMWGVILRYLPMYQDNEWKKQELITYIFRKLSIYSVVFLVLWFLLSPFFSSFFSLSSPYLVILVILTTVSHIFVAFFRAILYAEKRFLVFWINNIIEILFRIVASIILIQLWYGYIIVYVTYIIAMIGTIIILWPFVKKYFKWSIFKEYSFDLADLQKQLLPMTLLAIMLTLYWNIELIIAKRYLTVEEIAHLGSTILMWKIILAWLWLFHWVASPYFLKTRENMSYLIWVYSCFFLSLISAVFLYNLFPEFVIRTLFTTDYLVMAPSLGKMAVIMGILAFFSITWNHMIIAWKGYIAYLSTIPLCMIIASSFMFPPESVQWYIDTLFYSYIVSSVVLIITTGAIEWYLFRNIAH
jgi:Polysaccharide biosynthesis protein